MSIKDKRTAYNNKRGSIIPWNNLQTYWLGPLKTHIMKDRKSHNINFTLITDSEKEELKKRIFQSVHKLKIRKKRIRYTLGTAASIALIAGFGFYFFEAPTESIIDFVESSKTIRVNDSDKVVLILNESENVNIDEESSTINYSKTGQKVNIGTTKAIDQETSKNKKVVYNTLLVPYGKRSTIKLSDGSTIWLNSGSKLVYPAVFNGNKREVYLEGEAIFEVSHDKDHPFMVLSENQEIEVLGTVFNVSNYLDENSVSTVLKSGSVQISYKASDFNTSNKKIKLSPGTLASYNKQADHMETKKVDVYNYFSWRDGVLIFKNNDLKHIMAKLSRYYNVDIVVKDADLANETFSGYLDLKDDIEKVVGTIKETTDFNYTRTEKNKIVINK